jgi:hypothetical protein
VGAIDESADKVGIRGDLDDHRNLLRTEATPGAMDHFSH